MKRTSITVLLLTFLVSLLSTACDDGGKKTNNNNNVNPVCGNNIIETGETCDGTELGGLTCETVEGGFTGGTLACTDGCVIDTAGCTTGCTDECVVDNRVCNVNTLRVCEANLETGCTVWADTDCTLTSETCQVIDTVAQCASCTDACTLDEERCNGTADGIVATPACELQVGVPTCVSTCVDACTLDVKQCNLAGDGIETCITGASGCTEWDEIICDVATPECQDIAGVATCMAPNGSGETCADAYNITVPFYMEGTDFTADFTGIDMTFTDASCNPGYTGVGVDAVAALAMVAGESVVFAQSGGLDGQLFIQSVCDQAGTCLDTTDQYGTNSTEAILFQAPADGTYYFIVKAYDDAPTTVAYAIAVYAYEDPAELTCDDGFDNDIDGNVDCADSDCFGVGPCTTETLCGDGLDNDLDGDIDCADSDCVGLGACGPENSAVLCADGIDNDNDGNTDCADSDCVGLGACGPENTDAFCIDGIDNDGDGTIDCADADCASTGSCQLGESCAAPLVVTLPFNVTGTDFAADYLNNHSFTYTTGGCGTANGGEGVFAVTLTAGQQLRMDETGALDAVIRVLGVCTTTTPTCLLSSDTPETALVFTAPADGTYYVILEAYYLSAASAYNFSMFIVTANEVGLCADGVDNDNDTKIDCNDSDCFGQTGCTTELNCNDGLDNDADGNIDCADLDCAAALACNVGETCSNPEIVSVFPFNVTGTNITADFSNDHNFTYAAGGCGTANGSEGVFAVNLTAGQTIKLDETGALDSVIRVLGTCTTTTPTCLLSSDTPETNLFFTAPTTGTYYVILEAWSSTTTSAYNFTIALLPPETLCADGIDNEGDGKIDCADPDCAGVGSCGPENTDVFCADAFDNDGDGLVDCADPNCFGKAACPDLIISENFNTWPATGWTVVDGGTAGFTWVGASTPALTGATGTWAVVNSDAAGSGKVMAEELISPAFNCTGYTTVTLSFRHYYRDGSSSDSAFVDISIDGGATWNPTPVASYTASTTNGAIASLNISAQAAGQANVKIRFRYQDSNWGWYWLIDDFAVTGI